MLEERLPLILSYRFYVAVLVNAEGGEAEFYFVAQIQDIQMMACFLDFLSKEDMNIKVTREHRKLNKCLYIKDF